MGPQEIRQCHLDGKFVTMKGKCWYNIYTILHYAKEYIQYKEQVGFKLYLDNESVMRQIKKQQQYPYAYSFNTFTPGWDIIAQIVAVLCRSDIGREFEHVKGHQDKEKKYEDLPLPAQMNVVVDILVVAYLSQNMKSTIHTIHLPINPVQLHTSKTMINSHYFRTLQDQATKRPSPLTNQKYVQS
eukprot:15347242-Ditylum_brightwellii.AAC.1